MHACRHEGFNFHYDEAYLALPEQQPISLTMPLRRETYKSATMFPLFDGLIPEGWLLDIVEHNWKIDKRDRIGLLQKFCKNCIGAISVVENMEHDPNK